MERKHGLSINRKKNLLEAETNLNNKTQICKRMAEIYAGIMNKVGIETKVIGVKEKGQFDGELDKHGKKITVPEIYKCTLDDKIKLNKSDYERNEEGAKHYYTIVKTEEGNIAQDFLIEGALARIKSGEAILNNEMPGMCKLQDYEKRTNKNLPLNDLYVSKIKEEFYQYTKKPTNKNAMEFVFSKLNQHIEQFGFEEAKDYIMSLIPNVMPDMKHLKNINIINLVKENEKECDIGCIYNLEDTNFLLRGSNESTKITEKAGIITKDEIQAIINQGFEPRDNKSKNNLINLLEKEQTEKSIFTGQQIGKSTINTPTNQKDIAYNKVLDKIHEKNHPKKMYEHKIDK